MRNKVSVIDDYFMEIARGNVPGHSLLSKFGENPDIDGGFESIWDGGGIYAPPTQARIHNVASSDAADAGTVISSGTATGGSVTSLIDTGATFVTDAVALNDLILNDESVELGVVTAIVSEIELTTVRKMRDPATGQDGKGNLSGDAYRIVRDASTGTSVFFKVGLSNFFLKQSEFVVTNGLNVVPSVKEYRRQYRARVFSSASSGAVGVISSTAVTDGTVSLQVNDGNNQTLMAIHTLASNESGLLTRWWGSMSKRQSATSIVRLRVGQLDKIGYIQQSRSLKSDGSSEFDFPFPVPILFPGGADIWIEADSSAADVGIAGGFDMIEIAAGL